MLEQTLENVKAFQRSVWGEDSSVSWNIGAGALASGTTCWVVWRIARAKLRKGPPNANLKNTQSAEVDHGARDNARDAFKERKIPKEVDYVCVGSGIGSLFCAGLLAKAGKTVVVLEQHYTAGGCTHAFEEKGFEFDTGIHYVGSIQKYKFLVDFVSGRKKVEWAQLGTESNGFCYDMIKLGNDKPFSFRAGEDILRKDLIDEFPEEAAAIDKYLSLVKKVNKGAQLYFFAKLFHPCIQWLLNKTVNREFLRWSNKSTKSVMDEITGNNRLIAILCGQFGDYGLVPEESSFLIHAGVASHYLGGGFYPIGGSQEISRAIIPTIEAAGGRVLVRATVTEILLDSSRSRAVGVRVGGEQRGGSSLNERGSIVYAKHGVISGAGLKVTHALLTEENRPLLGYDKIFKVVDSGISHFSFFIGLKGSGEELGIESCNMWHLPVDKNYNYHGIGLRNTDKLHSMENPWGDGDLLMFVVFPSAKDPTFSKRHPGKSTCSIITQCPTAWFDEFVDEKNPARNVSGKRQNEKYTAFKAAIQARVMKQLYQLYPKLEGKVEYIEIGTPLTNQFYLGRPDSYGLENTPAHFSAPMDVVRPETNISNLFVTGQDTCTLGFAGALTAGMLTAHACLGYGFFEVMCGRNAISDLMSAQENKN